KASHTVSEEHHAGYIRKQSERVFARPEHPTGSLAWPEREPREKRLEPLELENAVSGEQTRASPRGRRPACPVCRQAGGRQEFFSALD
ncbi:MAG: hypothetical protein AAB590_01760, partial [Patescibacteria group bacterium]